MRMRSKAVTLIAAMIAAFAILPALGAAADELPQDVYEVEVPEGSFGFEVDENGAVVREFEVEEDGTVVELGDDGPFVFEPGENGGVLNEFQLMVDDTTYEVTINISDDEPSEPPADDGSDEGTYEVSYEVADDDGKGALVSTIAQCALTGQDAIAAGLPNHGYFVSAAARGETDFGFEVDGAPYEVDGAPVTFDLTDEEGVAALCTAVSDLVEGPLDEGSEEPTTEDTEELTTEDTEASHGEIVSTVAECAPRGRTARDAKLPNHGFFVSAAAKGEMLQLDVGTTTFGPYDLSTLAGADALCADREAMLTAQAESDADAEQVAVDVDEDGPDDADERRRGPGRSGDAPGRSGDAPGKSGEAPGQLKKND